MGSVLKSIVIFAANNEIMKKDFKPREYNSVSPYFIADDAQQLVELLIELFKAKEKRRYERPDGSIMHVELLIDDSIIMLGNSSEQFPANTHLMHIYVENVDETYDKAIALGCISIEAPKQRDDDPDRRGTFQDFAGNVWSVGTQL